MAAGLLGVIGANAAWLVVVEHKHVLARALIQLWLMVVRIVRARKKWLGTATMMFSVQVSFFGLSNQIKAPMLMAE